MADEQGNLPIEELGIELVVDGANSFISDMSKSGRQMTTFSQQIGRLVNSLPMLNIGLQDLTTQLSNINNRVGNVSKIAGALNQLGKMPNTVKNIGTNAESATRAVNKLYTSLAQAQSRMKDLRAAERAAQLETQRRQQATKGTTTAADATGKGAKIEKRTATAAEMAPRKFDVSPQAKAAARNLFAKDMDLAINVKLDLETGQLKKETAEALLAAIQEASKSASTGGERKAFAAIGAESAESLAAGLESAKGGVTDAAADLSRQIIVAIRDVLQMHSPSKVLGDIGYDGATSVAGGVRRGTPDVVAAATEMGQAAGQAASDAMSKFFAIADSMKAEALSDIDIVTKAMQKPGRKRPAAASVAEAKRQAALGVKAGAAAAGARAAAAFPRPADIDFNDPAMQQKMEERRQRMLAESSPDVRAAQRSVANAQQITEAMQVVNAFPENVRQAMEVISGDKGVHGVRKTVSNRGMEEVEAVAEGLRLELIQELAGAVGTLPGTQIPGSSKVRRSLRPIDTTVMSPEEEARFKADKARNQMFRSVARRGGGVTMGHDRQKRDFDSPLFQEKMRAFPGLDATMQTVKPGTEAWNQILAKYSAVSKPFAFQPKEAALPKSFKGTRDDIEKAAQVAFDEIIVKQMGMAADDLPALAHRLKRANGRNNETFKGEIFENLVKDSPVMQAFSNVTPKELRQFLMSKAHAQKSQEKLIGAGNVAPTAELSSSYQNLQDIIAHTTDLDEAIAQVIKEGERIKAQQLKDYAESGLEIYKALANRDDPGIKAVVAKLQSLKSRKLENAPGGGTIGEAVKAEGDAWQVLIDRYGNKGAARQALSMYEQAVRTIEMPTIATRTMQEWANTQRPIRTLSADMEQDRQLRQERFGRAPLRTPVQMWRSQQNMREADLRDDAQGSRLAVTEMQRRRMVEQVPDPASLGVDKEKVLEAANAAVAIEWELKAQEDAINKAAEAYARKNGRTLEQVNQAVENVRSGKNTRAGKPLTELAKAVAAYDQTLKRWEDATNAYVEKLSAAQRVASQAIGKSIAKGELRSAGAKYFDAEDQRVNPEGMNVRTRNLRFEPGGLVRKRDALGRLGAPEVFDTSRTKRKYQPDMLGATMEAAHAGEHLTRQPIRNVMPPYLQEKRRIRQAQQQSGAELQASLAKMAPAPVGGGAPADLELRAQKLQVYGKQFEQLINSKMREFTRGPQEAMDSIGTATENFLGKAVAWARSFADKGVLDPADLKQFYSAILESNSRLTEMAGQLKAGKEVDLGEVKQVTTALNDRIEGMSKWIVGLTRGMAQAEDEAQAAAAAAKQAATQNAPQAKGWRAFTARSTPQAQGWRAATGGAAAAAGATASAAGGAARQAAQTFSFPDDWVVKIVNAIGQAADKIVAAVRGIRLEITGGGVAENVGPTGAQKQAGKPKQTEAEDVRPLANMQADFIRRSEVDAYRAAHTAMRQVRMANELNPEEVKRLQSAIDAWRKAAIKDATDSIKVQAERGDVVDTWRGSTSQSMLDLQKIVGPEIRKTIENQETATGARTTRALQTAFDDIARKEREVTAALQKSGAPAAQLEKDLKAVALAAELAREDVVGLLDKSESFQILDASIDNVVNGFKEMGEQAKFAAKQADRTPLMQRQLAIRTRADSITRDAERTRATARDQLTGRVPQTELDRILGNIDNVAKGATHELAVMLNEARKGGVGAENSIEAFNLQLQKVRSNASADIDVLRRLVALTEQNARAKAKATPGAATAAAVPGQPVTRGFDTKRTLRGASNMFRQADTRASSLLGKDFVDQTRLQELMAQLAGARQDMERMITKALHDTAGKDLQTQADAVNDVVQSMKGGVATITAELKKMESVSNAVAGSFEKIDHAAASVRDKVAATAQSRYEKVKQDTFAPTVAFNFGSQIKDANKKLTGTANGIVAEITALHKRATEAAKAGDLAQAKALTLQIQNLGKTAIGQIDATYAQITARADKIEAQLERVKQFQGFAKDPSSFLQEKTNAQAKTGGLGGFMARMRLNLREADARAEMFANVSKHARQETDRSVVFRTIDNAAKGAANSVANLIGLLTAPITMPIIGVVKIIQKIMRGIDLLRGKWKEMVFGFGARGRKQEFLEGFNEDDRGQRYAALQEKYATLFQKVNRVPYDKFTAKKKFFAPAGFDSSSLRQQASDFGKLQSAFNQLEKSAVKQGLLDKPVSAVGRAATAATKPVQVLVDVVTLGATKGAREAKALNAELAKTGDTAEGVAYQVKRSGLFGRKVTVQPRTTDGRFAAGAAPTMGFNDIMSPASQANAKRGMKKLFADMGTGVGLGFGMSFSMGIVNAIQNMAWRIQSTIGGVISNGMSAVIETEMRKMTIQSFVSQDMMEAAGPGANFGDIWVDAKAKANDYYKEIANIAKISSFSRKPLLDVFNNMQVGGLTADNAAASTRAVTMFADAFMPGQKQVLDTFGQQMMQMLSQGVAQQVDLKLLAQQGIPVYDFLAKNLPRLQGKSKGDAQSQIFDEIGKGGLGATEALEAITKGMVDAAENMKGEVASTFSGLMSTFQDLMLEKSEAIMGPVAENLIKPFIEFANDFLQSNPITKMIEDFGKQIDQISQVISGGFATALGVLYGLWNSLPAPIQATIAALAEAAAIMGTLTAAIAGVAAIGALLAPMFGIITSGMLIATAAIGGFVAAWTNNLFGFQDWLTGWAVWAYNWAIYLGTQLATGLLNAVGDLSTAGAKVVNDFGKNFMANMEGIYAAVYGFGQQIGATIGAGMAVINDYVSMAIEWLWALPQNAAAIVGSLGQIWNDLGAGFNSLTETVWAWVQNTIDAIWALPENMDQVGSQMLDWGANIVEMFAQGMQGAVNVVFDALQAIGSMFEEWLTPGSPPKLLPDLTTWGTGAADAYLEGWTKADFSIMNELAGKLEEAFAIDEGAMKQGELDAVRSGVADMVDKATMGITDTSAVITAIPGWGGRLESVTRLTDAYAKLAVSQHALTVEQEALDAVTVKYDAILKPLEARLESIRNKQEALDLTDQIREYQNILDNVYATDRQKAGAKLKMEELKLSQQINDTEMARDKLTDPINERIGALTAENQLNQDALDLALARWDVEVGMLKAGQQKEKGAGGDMSPDALDKAAKDAAAAGGAEKNRQFTQPKLNVPGITGKNGLGSIGSKMKELSDKISGYFSTMGDKAKPLVDALGGIAGNITLVKQAIDDGFTSGAFTTEGGFNGFLNNVGAALLLVTTNITSAKSALDAFVLQVQAAWNTPFGGAAGPEGMGPKTKPQAQDSGDFGGFKQIGKDVNAQATLVQRAQAVVVVVEENLGTVLDSAKTDITTFATDISTAVSAIDWATIQTNFTTGLGDVTGSITTFAGDVQKKIAAALGVDFKETDTVVDKLDKTTGAVTEKTGTIAAGAGKLASGVIKIIADKLNSYTMTDEQVTGITAGSIIVIGETIKNLNIGMAEFLQSAEAQELFNAAGKQVGMVIVGLIAGAAFGGVYEALKGQEILEAQKSAKDAVTEMFVEFLKGLAKQLVDSAAEALGVPPGALEDVAKAFGGEQITTGLENLSKAIEPLTTMATGGPLGALKGGMQLSGKAQDAAYAFGRDLVRQGQKGPGIYYGNEMEQMRADLKAQQEAVALQSQLAAANAQLFPTMPSGFDPSVTPRRDKSQDNIKSILDVNLNTVLPQMQSYVPPVPAVAAPAAPQQMQGYVPPKQPPAIKMELGGLDPAKMFQGQVTAATTAGQAAGANFSKAYSTATTTAMAAATTTGKTVFKPVEIQAQPAAQLTWSSFLTGLQKGAAGAATTTGATGIGSDVVGGIAQGAISAITTSPLLAMVPMLLVKFFQSSLGIQSPSTVFATLVGTPIGQGIVQGISTALVGSGGAGEGIQAVITTALDNVVASMAVFSLNMQVAWLNLKTAVAGVLAKLSADWLTVFDEFFEEANTRFDDFATNWIEEKVPEFVAALIELAVQAKEGFLQVMQEAVDGLQEKLDEMLAILSNEDLLASFYEKGQDLGENIADGIAAGMTSRHAAGEFAHAAEKIVDMINDAISAAAQIESPSKVMAREIGVPLAAGIAVGMTSPTAHRYLETSAGDIIERIVASFQDSSAPQATARTYLRQPEQNVVSMMGVTKEYHMHMNITPQMAERVDYHFQLMEVMAS